MEGCPLTTVTNHSVILISNLKPKFRILKYEQLKVFTIDKNQHNNSCMLDKIEDAVHARERVLLIKIILHN